MASVMMSFFLLSASPFLFNAKTLANSRLKENIVMNSAAGGYRLTALKPVEQALTCSCLDNHNNTTSCVRNKNLHCYSSPNDLQNMWNNPLKCPPYLYVVIQEKYICQCVGLMCNNSKQNC